MRIYVSNSTIKLIHLETAQTTRIICDSIWSESCLTIVSRVLVVVLSGKILSVLTYMKQLYKLALPSSGLKENLVKLVLRVLWVKLVLEALLVETVSMGPQVL